jgi:hypothetical protein
MTLLMQQNWPQMHHWMHLMNLMLQLLIDLMQLNWHLMKHLMHHWTILMMLLLMTQQHYC